uniref:Uncharacterized protein n=1 Tax=Oryza sativa subsp. japonica TaxID=39947 RepID=Q69NB0_ORYSJ|nr:hypothetical protein [Oryza sativa Japonica Group]
MEFSSRRPGGGGPRRGGGPPRGGWRLASAVAQRHEGGWRPAPAAASGPACGGEQAASGRWRAEDDKIGSGKLHVVALDLELSLLSITENDLPPPLLRSPLSAWIKAPSPATVTGSQAMRAMTRLLYHPARSLQNLQRGIL